MSNILKEKKEKLGLSIRKIAELAGVHRGTVQHMLEKEETPAAAKVMHALFCAEQRVRRKRWEEKQELSTEAEVIEDE